MTFDDDRKTATYCSICRCGYWYRMPKRHSQQPFINVLAMNTCEIICLEASIAREILLSISAFWCGDMSDNAYYTMRSFKIAIVILKPSAKRGGSFVPSAAVNTVRVNAYWRWNVIAYIAFGIITFPVKRGFRRK